MNIQSNISLKDKNTFGVDVIAQRYIEINSIEDIKMLSNFFYEDITILGEGSNVLFTTNPKCIIVKNNLVEPITITKVDNNFSIVKISSGYNWHQAVLFAIENNLGGIENLSLIPGTCGAAPMQNIGAYGVELKNVVEQVEAFDLQDHKMKYFTNADCLFGYRESIFKKENIRGRYFITSITLKLTHQHILNTSYGEIENKLADQKIINPTIKNISDIIIGIRQAKIPNPAELGNAGSFFKNPEISIEQFNELKANFTEIPNYLLPNGNVKIPAGWLIEFCGFKGKIIGNTGCHKNQALVIVNYGNASGTEILSLANNIIFKVFETFGITLHKEVNIY